MIVGRGFTPALFGFVWRRDQGPALRQNDLQEISKNATNDGDGYEKYANPFGVLDIVIRRLKTVESPMFGKINEILRITEGKIAQTRQDDAENDKADFHPTTSSSTFTGET
jgi:hypothetical protein